MRFDELDLDYDVLDAIETMHFEECTPVQEQTIPVALEGHDIMAVAQTGTGKTAAYLLPVIDRLTSGDYPTDHINCVIMVPTHELAQQIDRQMEGFSYFLPVTSLAIHGGSDGKAFARQQNGLKQGVDVVIATPGRLLAHLQMGYVDLSHVSWFILDEADRMLDMGFYGDIMQIEKNLPRERQTMMFSATMPDKIQTLAKTILRDPREIKIAISRPTEKIAQSAYVCYEPQKTPILLDLFKRGYNKRVIIFAASKLKVKDLARELRRAHWKAGEMHSDLDQVQRESVMNDFRAGRIDILVATDIVARGIDIDDITMVVNYDVPREAEDYVHRIGRTARAGTEGKAVTLVAERDQPKFKYIERFLGYDVLKETMPESVGDGPAYTGRDKSRGKSGGKSGSGNKNRRNPTNSGHGRKKTPRKAQPATQPTDTPATAPQAETTTDSGTPATDKTKKRRRWYGPRRQS